MGFVLILAVVSSIAAYGALMVASSQARQGTVLGTRFRARYAAEAGIVIAQAKLWRDPAYCPAAAPEPIDTDGNGSADTTVELTVTNCGAGNAHEVRAKVAY